MFLGGFSSDMTGVKATALERWCRERGQAYLRFDYSGHGASEGEFADGTIGRWAEEALEVLDRLTQGPQILVGSSMGAWIMLLAALARPQRIAALLGLACAADFTRYLLWDRLDESQRDRLRREGVIRLPSPYGAPYTLTLKLIEEAERHRLLDKSKLPITCPVRLIHGMRDADVPWRISAQVAERLTGSDARVLLLKDGEHTLSRERDLAVLVRTLDELLDGR
ncbi:MAG: alpha/beta hydrolase [Candidatus Competibacteraceae bacterium]|nr:alpha/beta hydrolase [Candidatus Competibacteraceae bacterium]